MSQFNPQEFLDATIEQANDTVIIPVPAGEFPAVCEEAKIDTWQSSKDPSKAGLKLTLQWQIHDENVRAIVGREKVMVRQQVMLDLTEDGKLDMGKGRNVGLGRLREACDCNKPGVPFRMSDFIGKAAKVTTTHRPKEDDPSVIYVEVKQVARI